MLVKGGPGSVVWPGVRRLRFQSAGFMMCRSWGNDLVQDQDLTAPGTPRKDLTSPNTPGPVSPPSGHPGTLWGGPHLDQDPGSTSSPSKWGSSDQMSILQAINVSDLSTQKVSNVWMNLMGFQPHVGLRWDIWHVNHNLHTVSPDE